MSTATVSPALNAVDAESNYLNSSHGLKSWLLTQDHKRIALLYLIGVTFFFAIGGLLAFLLRLELLTPGSDLMAMDTYNKVFTMHGIVMVFFVLIPAVPAVLGNKAAPAFFWDPLVWTYTLRRHISLSLTSTSSWSDR